MASMLASELQADALICFGYPFHPPGKLNQLRIEHLKTIAALTLILQGERDRFGRRGEADLYPLSSSVCFHCLADGDHSFKPRKASGRSESDNLRQAIQAAAFLASLV